MSKYLDKFNSTMPAIQAKQIFKLLNDLKDQGAIKTVSEYNAKLQELSAILRGTNPTPVYKFFQPKVGEFIDSDRFNAMASAAAGDLETAFGEASNISDVLDLHKTLYSLTVLKGLERSITELEKTISLYEFFSRDTTGFTHAQYNTFTETNARTLRSVIDSNALFRDTRKDEDISTLEDMTIDLLGQQLIMPIANQEEVKIIDIEIIQDAETLASALDVQYSTSSLQNIRDGEKYTYWLYPVLTDFLQVGGVKLKLRLDLGGLRQINLMQIEPASSFPMVLSNFTYTGADNIEHEVEVDSAIVSDSSFDIGDVLARYVTLTFIQKNEEEAVYSYDPIKDIWERTWKDDLDGEEEDQDRISRINEELKTEIPDQKMRDILGIKDTDTVQDVSVYQYTFGFDNIRFYKNDYGTRGIFVSPVLKVDKPGIIALKTVETIPETLIGDTSYPQFSFEYTVVKYDYDVNGTFIGQETVPILPIDYNLSLSHERLHLVQRESSAVNNIATLRFTPNIHAGSPVISKNLSDVLLIGDPLLPTTDYVARAEGQSSWQTTWAGVMSFIDANSETGTVPMTVYVKFTNPSVHSIYTISYTASSRNSNAVANSKQRRLTDFISLYDTGALGTSIEKKSTVETSELYLVIVARNNYLSNAYTAGLTEYKLLAAVYDETKYE